jgi:hypothetical protein
LRTIIVQLPARAGQSSPSLLELAPGQEATFGRGTGDRSVDIFLPGPGISRVAGRIRAIEDYWLLSNLSRDKTYVVENMEGAGEFVKAAPRRLDMPVPFEFARVVLPVKNSSVSFTVFAPEHSYADGLAPESPTGEQTLAAFALDETAKYFLVLVALCEPRLRDGSSVVIPSVPQIVDRLRGLESCRTMTRTAANFHIEYLARTKLRVKEPSSAGPAAKADWQREALVSLALRFDLVREEHLALLPAGAGRSQGVRSPGGSGSGAAVP